VSVKVGEPAPAFTLSGTGGRQYSLADFAGPVEQLLGRELDRQRTSVTVGGRIGGGRV
jgi:hypothetical protein